MESLRGGLTSATPPELPFPLTAAPLDPEDTEQLFLWPPPPYERMAMTKEEIDSRRATRLFLRSNPAVAAKRAGLQIIRERIRIKWYQR